MPTPVRTRRDLDSIFDRWAGYTVLVAEEIEGSDKLKDTYLDDELFEDLEALCNALEPYLPD